MNNMENSFINVDKLLYVKKFSAVESELYTFENPIFDKKGFYYCYGCRYMEEYIGKELTEDLLIEHFIKDNIVYEKPCVKLQFLDKTTKFFYYTSEEECQKGFEEIIQQLKEIGVKLL